MRKMRRVGDLVVEHLVDRRLAASEPAAAAGVDFGPARDVAEILLDQRPRFARAVMSPARTSTALFGP